MIVDPARKAVSMKTKESRLSEPEAGMDPPDILGSLCTPEARAQLANDEARIHKNLIDRARLHDRYLAESQQLGYRHVTP